MAKKQNLTPIKIKQADADGLIKDVVVMVAPTYADVLPTLVFGKEKKRRRALVEQAETLVTAAFALRKERLNDSSITAGEAALVGDDIDGDQRDAVRRIRRKSINTLTALVQNFDGEPSSLQRLDKMLDDTKFIIEDRLFREAIVFNKSMPGEHFSLIMPQIDNLRACHPSLARADLSELDGDLLEAAHKLLQFSIRFENEEQGKRRANPTRGEFSSQLDSARAKIIRHTPHITPAFASVVIDHPEKLDQVLKALEDRNVMASRSDSLIQEILNASTPLSSGAL